MVVDILLGLLILVSIGGIVWMVIKKLPVIKLIDTDQVIKIRQEQVRLKVAQARLKRQWDWLKGRFSNLTAPILSKFEYWRQNLQQKVKQVEDDIKQKIVQTKTETKSVDQLLEQALASVKAEDWENAEHLYLEVIRQSPRELRAYEGLGEMYLAQKEYESAREIYEYLIQHHPTIASYHLGLARTYLGSGQLDKAKESYQSSLQFNPEGLSQICLELAEVCKDLCQIAEAWENANKARQLEPGNPRILDFFIEISIVNERPTDAQSALDALRQVNPENKKISHFDKQIKELIDKLRPKKRLSRVQYAMGVRLNKKSSSKEEEVVD